VQSSLQTEIWFSDHQVELTDAIKPDDHMKYSMPVETRDWLIKSILGGQTEYKSTALATANDAWIEIFEPKIDGRRLSSHLSVPHYLSLLFD
jgi:hypothetical protein